jgi:hypothetical protein
MTSELLIHNLRTLADAIENKSKVKFRVVDCEYTEDFSMLSLSEIKNTVEKVLRFPQYTIVEIINPIEIELSDEEIDFQNKVSIACAKAICEG